MGIRFKSFISCGLCLLIITAILHVDAAHENFYQGYKLCKLETENYEHHNSSHQCEKCLVKETKSELQSTIVLCFDSFFVSYKYEMKKFEKYSTSFGFYSRPPPTLFS